MSNYLPESGPERRSAIEQAMMSALIQIAASQLDNDDDN